MSVIAHYFYRQVNPAVSPAAEKTVTAQVAAPAGHSVPAASAKASFQAALSSSQHVIEQTAVKSEPKPATPRPSLPASTTPTLEQLVKFARAQGWSEKQIALMKRLSLRKNSRTGQPWSALAEFPGGRRQETVQRTAVNPARKQALGTEAVDASTIRGIRNNNPGNLEASDVFQWQGQTGNDGRFATFSSPEHGIRALGKNLLAYHRRGLDTISKIISRWAPPQDNNDTSSYINKVSQALGVTPDTPLNVASPHVLSALSKAIIHHENGVIPFSEQVINSGVFSALELQAMPRSAPTPMNYAQAVPGLSSFVLQAQKMTPTELAALRHSLSQRVQAAKIMLRSEGEAINIPSKAELVTAWGYTEGSQRFQELHNMIHSKKNRKKSGV